MNFFARLAPLLSLTLTLSLACNKDSDKTPAGDKTLAGDESETTATQAASAVEAKIEIVDPFEKKEVKAIASMSLPAGWQAHEFFDGTWVPGEKVQGVDLKVSTSCGGMCGAEKMSENIDELFKSYLLLDSSKNGPPHLVPTIESIDEGKLPLGRYRAYRVSYPKAPEGSAQGVSKTYLECYLHDGKSDFYVAAQASAVPEEEKRIWPALLNSCKAASYEIPGTAGETDAPAKEATP